MFLYDSKNDVYINFDLFSHLNVEDDDLAVCLVMTNPNIPEGPDLVLLSEPYGELKLSKNSRRSLQGLCLLILVARDFMIIGEIKLCLLAGKIGLIMPGFAREYRIILRKDKDEGDEKQG